MCQDLLKKKKKGENSIHSVGDMWLAEHLCYIKIHSKAVTYYTNFLPFIIISHRLLPPLDACGVK